jgi:hypothetical protein
MGRTACTEPQCLYNRAIPLLPLWAVRPVQSLSACTVELYIYSPYGPYGLYRASVPVQDALYLLYKKQASSAYGRVMQCRSKRVKSRSAGFQHFFSCSKVICQTKALQDRHKSNYSFLGASAYSAKSGRCLRLVRVSMSVRRYQLSSHYKSFCKMRCWAL